MKKHFIFIILLISILIFGLQNINAYTITNLEINQSYGGLNSGFFEVEVTVDDATSLSEVPLTLDSTKHASEVISFEAVKISSFNTFKANFYIDFQSSSSSTEDGWPKIIVDSTDTVIVKDNNGQGKSANLIVDGEKPTIGNFQINSLGDFFEKYYRSDVNLNLSGFSDSGSYLKNYIIYLVSVSNLDSFKNNFIIKKVTDNNSSLIKLDLNSSIPNDDYYILVDAVDAASNTGDETLIKDNKKNLYVDNTPPTISNFNLGTFIDKSVYYVNSNNFNIQIGVEDLDSGIDTSNPPTVIGVIKPSDGIINRDRDYNSLVNGFYVPISGENYKDGDIFKVHLDVADKVDNNISYDFNIFIDKNAPTTPSKPTLSRTIDNNVTISAWGNSTDQGSGLKEYRVYRSTSDFTKYTTQTLICTLDSKDTKNCLDTSSKSDDTTYYYGVVGIDNSNNYSLVETSSIKSGPKIKIEINILENYTNNITPDIDLTLGSDVNAVRFSCNASSFTSWIEVNDTTFTYSEFDITKSSSGCDTKDGVKTIYAEAKSKNSPYLTSRTSTTVKFDKNPPTVPTNLKVTNLSDGGLSLSWSKSDDEYSGLKSYKIYYSTTSGVTNSNAFLTSNTNNYSYKPNDDQNHFFKISAIDKAGNESSLSTEASGVSKRFGPSFLFNLQPANLINETYYVGLGLVNFKITSDEDLHNTPVVKIKIGSNPYEKITPNYNNLIASFDYDFKKDGNAEVSITGKNKKGEEATDILKFIVDVNKPVFTVDYNVFDNIIKFNLESQSPDLYKVQYILDKLTEICILEDVNKDFSCELDTEGYPDGFYTIEVIGYDYALNFSVKEIKIEIDNINEVDVEREKLIDQVNLNIDEAKSLIKLYEDLLIPIDDSILDKMVTVNTKISSAQKLIDENKPLAAVDIYTETNNLLLDIISLLPKYSILKNKTFTYFYDSNQSIDISTHTYDQNVIVDTNNLYNQNSIIIDRNFSIIEIDGLKYYLSSLEFKNTSDKDVNITVVEEIPKDFASNISDLIFNEEIQVLNKDPLVLKTIKIPKNSSYFLKYNKKSSITDFDVLTKFDQINFKKPIILSGVVLKEQIKYDATSSLGFNSLIFKIIGISLVLIIILLIVVWQILKLKKKKQRSLETLSAAKNEINYYLNAGESSLDKLNEEGEISRPEVSDITKSNAFESNYDYIIDAVKRNKK